MLLVCYDLFRGVLNFVSSYYADDQKKGKNYYKIWNWCVCKLNNMKSIIENTKKKFDKGVLLSKFYCGKSLER